MINREAELYYMFVFTEEERKQLNALKKDFKKQAPDRQEEFENEIVEKYGTSIRNYPLLLTNICLMNYRTARAHAEEMMQNQELSDVCQVLENDEEKLKQAAETFYKEHSFKDVEDALFKKVNDMARYAGAMELYYCKLNEQTPE